MHAIDKHGLASRQAGHIHFSLALQTFKSKEPINDFFDGSINRS